MKVIYLACPYYHKNLKIMSQRVNIATRVCYEVLSKYRKTIKFMFHEHQIRKICNAKRGWEFWGNYDKAILEHCNGMIVLQLPGWEDSKGVAAEIEIAKRKKMTISYLSEEKIKIIIKPSGEAS